MWTEQQITWLDQIGLARLHDGSRLDSYDQYVQNQLLEKMQSETFEANLKKALEEGERYWNDKPNMYSISSLELRNTCIRTACRLALLRRLDIIHPHDWEAKQERIITSERIIWCKRNSGMIEEYRGYQFSMYRLYDDRQKRMVTELQAYVRQPDRMFDTLGLMVFSGSPGTGKTVLGHCMINEVINHTGNPCRFVRFPNLLSEMVRAIADHRTTIHQLTEGIVNTQFLVLDEVGYDATDFTWKQLLDIVDKRLVARRPTIIVTNFSPEALGKMMGEKYKALYSRMFSNSTITYLCEWQDYRQWEVRS